jgi:preprotein translocase subunit YajC
MLQFIFLQTPQPTGFNWSFVFLMMIPVVMYFFMIRPQVKREKERQKFVESLREGLEVITNSGIIGKITKIDGGVVRLMVDEKTFIRVVKSAIQSEYKPA